MNDRGILLVVSGPSGVGKGTVIKRVFENDKRLFFSVSATTRRPREGEEDGVHYHFISHEQFAGAIQSGEMLEYAEYSGNYYGTPRRSVEQELEKGHDVVLDIEVQGARQVKKIFPEAILVFIMPPSLAELERRLRDRGTEDEDSVKMRLAASCWELRNAPGEYDYVVINDRVESAADLIEAILTAARCQTSAMGGFLRNFLKEVPNIA